MARARKLGGMKRKPNWWTIDPQCMDPQKGFLYGLEGSKKTAPNPESILKADVWFLGDLGCFPMFIFK